ncbi:MAG: hypothetical protein ACHQEB_02270 [Chitinophagales bacterium]
MLISPILIQIDTRIPKAELRWVSIGKILLWHEEEWWLSFQVFFFRKKIRLAAIKTTTTKIGKEPGKKKRKLKMIQLLKKMIRVMKTFRVIEWQLGIDTGDYVRNAWLYPLNFLPDSRGHMQINFRDENYFFIRIKNHPWKILYAYLR